MSIVITLSDSDEHDSPAKNDSAKETGQLAEKNFDDFCLSDEFPEVFFEHDADADRSRENSPVVLHTQRSYLNELQKRSESSSSDEDSPLVQESLGRYNSKERRYGSQRPAHSLSDSCESGNGSDGHRNEIGEIPLTQKVTKGKSKNVEEKLTKKEKQAREKALKAVALKKLKDIKPGECMKYMEVILDEGIETSSFGSEIKSALGNADLKYTVSAQLIPNSITWKRQVEESYVDESNKICTVINTELVDQAIVIWTWDQVIEKVTDHSFAASISSVKSILPHCNLTLIIFGAEGYFSHRKLKNSNRHDEKKKSQKANKNSQYVNSPDVSRRQLETCLNEIQITMKCNSRLIDSSQDLALTVCQYTKAIAEIPYKNEKNKTLTNKFDWYVMGDNRNTVRVDKDGNGLKRLWQQQLCQFNLSSLEIAEAICSVYPSPAHLIEAYTKITEQEGVNLLKDIPIRRAAGPLTTTRKIGAELSKKIYTMFTSENGEISL